MKESEWIEHLSLATRAPDGVVGIGDDAAVLPGGLLVTTDTYVEDLHFRVEWDSWRGIGAKMAQSAISDIAAMGGKPLYLFANLSSSAGKKAAEGILEGLIASGVPLLGGDTTAGAGGKTVVTITVMGETDRPVLRSGARIGDTLYVSGPLGGSEFGLRALKEKFAAPESIRKFLAPRARTDLALKWGASASAMIDVSDGLSTEAYRIAKASGVSLFLDLEAIPVPSELKTHPELLPAILLSSGDEYELLAASSTLLPGGTAIGSIEKGSGVRTKIGPLQPTGYEHELG